MMNGLCFTVFSVRRFQQSLTLIDRQRSLLIGRSESPSDTDRCGCRLKCSFHHLRYIFLHFTLPRRHALAAVLFIITVFCPVSAVCTWCSIIFHVNETHKSRNTSRDTHTHTHTRRSFLFTTSGWTLIIAN